MSHPALAKLKNEFPEYCFLALFLISTLAGCKQDADEFFSGRPSGMSQVSNRVIGGGPETVKELLRIPLRFPEAKPLHIVQWQHAISSWWANGEKRGVIVNALAELTPSERRALSQWGRTRQDSIALTEKEVSALNEFLVTVDKTGS